MHCFNTTLPLPSGCSCETHVDARRRRVIRIAAVGMAAPFALTVWPAQASLAGDRLVEEDAEGAPAPLRVADLKPGKPVVAFPLDAKRNEPRNDSRLNKIVLIRLPEAEMSKKPWCAIATRPSSHCWTAALSLPGRPRARCRRSR
jgi:hypothetical protein